MCARLVSVLVVCLSAKRLKYLSICGYDGVVADNNSGTVRISIDLTPQQHLDLRLHCLNLTEITGTRVTGRQVVQALIEELTGSPELRLRIVDRLTNPEN